MQDIEEKVLMLRDAALTADCQLFYDYQGPHNRNFFGKEDPHYCSLVVRCMHDPEGACWY